ncbi:hypothetical protein HDE_07669 [Halotydeus destructor]|nr:hypothetical protein HDE_07669 [Halotydeus destructor]
MEAEFHSLTFILLIYSFTVKPRPGNPIFEDRKEARTYLNWARDLTQFYIQHKDYFVDKYAAILENEEVEEMGDIRIAAALV